MFWHVEVQLFVLKNCIFHTARTHTVVSIGLIASQNTQCATQRLCITTRECGHFSRKLNTGHCVLSSACALSPLHRDLSRGFAVLLYLVCTVKM